MWACEAQPLEPDTALHNPSRLCLIVSVGAIPYGAVTRDLAQG